MWSRTQNYPLDNNDHQISIINRFFDFINNTRRVNNRIIEQNDNLTEMGYELIVAFIHSSRTNNSNTYNNNATSTPSNVNIPSRNNSSRRRVRSSRYTSMRNDWRNTNRNNNRNLWQRNVRPRNVNVNNNVNNNNNNNNNNVSRNPIQTPLTNIIPMFGPLSFQPTTNNNTLEQLFQQSLQSVPIRPSADHIERATEERIFNQIRQPINDTCPITRNRFNDNDTVLQILECRHCFNPSSLRRWFETSVRCPICRYDIREYNPLNVVHNPYRNNNDNDNDIENPLTQTQDNEINTEDTQDEEDNVTEDTTSSQDIARELVINELDNINNNPQITEEQRNLANIISQSMSNSSNNEELIQTETSIDSNGNLNLTYQFGLNLPQTPP